MDNNTTEIIRLASRMNLGINKIFGPVVCINSLIILLLSISWSVYLFNEILKVSLKYKKKLKSRNFISEHQWLNDLRNLYSKKVRNIFLIAICLSECIIFLSLLVNELLYYQLRERSIEISSFASFESFASFASFTSFTKSYLIRIDFEFYHSMNYVQLRIFQTLTTTSFYTLFLSVRILTQYLVHQYSYYKLPFWFKFKLAISLLIIFSLFICGVVRQLVLIHFICIVLVVIYEFICICIATKKLRLLLTQRLNDAIMHENQSTDVIRYYKIANKDYKLFSTVLLIALFLQTIGFSMVCIHPIVVTIFAFPNSWIESILYLPQKDIGAHFYAHHIAVAYSLIVSSIEEVFITTGFSLQVIPYFLVSFIRLIRNIKKKVIANRNIPRENSLLTELIEENQVAYRRNH